ncbi:MAG: DUF2911 domain-containing protein [Chitinophagaceae bacterium]|nr:MAG: DUF2911 domain-containing protein [Chitinophagaceae bacterium]
MKRMAAICCFLLAACSEGADPYVSVPDSANRQRDTAPLPAAMRVNKLLPVDMSPLDVVYFPVDYPVRKMDSSYIAAPKARVIYSRPHKGGRVIFGGLLKYGEPWRLGANEATELELFSAATVQGQVVPKGRYILYCIPGPNEWVIVFNRNVFSWGLKPDVGQDAFRFTVPVQGKQEALEHFTMVFQQSVEGADLVMGWDDVRTRLSFVFKS